MPEKNREMEPQDKTCFLKTYSFSFTDIYENKWTYLKFYTSKQFSSAILRFPWIQEMFPKPVYLDKE